VTARFTGGLNLIPDLRWNVYVLPPFVGFGTVVATSGTILFPAALASWLYPTSVRTSRLSRIPIASPRYSPVGSMLSVKPNACSQPTLSVPPALTVFAFVECAEADTVIATATAVTMPTTVVSLQIGFFTISFSFLPPRRTDRGCVVARR